MPERSTRVVDDAVRDAGTRLVSSPVTVDNDATAITIAIDRTFLTISDPETLIEWELWVSVNGGDFAKLHESACHGGVLLNDLGGPILQSYWTFGAPPGRNRRLELRTHVKRQARFLCDIDSLVTRGVR